MMWSLLEEVGLERAGPALRGAGEGQLRYPVFAARAADGTTLIVDERATHKGVPLRAEYRSLLVGLDGTVVQDSATWGVEDGPACLLRDGTVAVLRIPRWQLALLSAAGVVCATVDLWTISKKTPVVVAPTSAGTFLVAFADTVFDVEIVELDRDGRLLWELPPAAGRQLGFPGSLQLLPNGNVLVCDEFGHVAVELTRGGDVAWQLGTARDPGGHGQRLSSPRAVREVAGGVRLVADTRNHRILEAGLGGDYPAVLPPKDLCAPTFADRLANGHLLVCDAGNGRVLECDETGRVVWRYGDRQLARRTFSFPRSVEVLASGGVLVGDTANDRVVVVEDGGCREWPVQDGRGLFWPRCARMLASGSVLIADGRHGRVLELTPDGRVVNELHRLDGGPTRELEDPHDVRLLPDGRLLVTDAPPGVVVETDWQGHMHRCVKGLRDPHSAQLLSDGRLMITDSGADRVLWVGPDGAPVAEWQSVSDGRARLRLSGPRYVEQGGDGAVAVADTGNNRVLVATEDGELIAELSSVPGSPVPSLDQPRWAVLPAPGELMVADYGHHRVLRLSYEAP